MRNRYLLMMSVAVFVGFAASVAHAVVRDGVAMLTAWKPGGEGNAVTISYGGSTQHAGLGRYSIAWGTPPLLIIENQPVNVTVGSGRDIKPTFKGVAWCQVPGLTTGRFIPDTVGPLVKHGNTNNKSLAPFCQGAEKAIRFDLTITQDSYGQ